MNNEIVFPAAILQPPFYMNNKEGVQLKDLKGDLDDDVRYLPTHYAH
jgi:hypothetical protein